MLTKIGTSMRQAIAARLRRWANSLDRESAPRPQPPPSVGGGPPAHWLEAVKRGAPHLLRNLPDQQPSTANLPAPQARAKVTPSVGKPNTPRPATSSSQRSQPFVSQSAKHNYPVRFVLSEFSGRKRLPVEFPYVEARGTAAGELESWPRLSPTVEPLPMNWPEEELEAIWPALVAPDLADVPPDLEQLAKEMDRLERLDTEQRGL